LLRNVESGNVHVSKSGKESLRSLLESFGLVLCNNLSFCPRNTRLQVYLKKIMLAKCTHKAHFSNFFCFAFRCLWYWFSYTTDTHICQSNLETHCLLKIYFKFQTCFNVSSKQALYFDTVFMFAYLFPLLTNDLSIEINVMHYINYVS
jgi:hypothetical protein